MHLYTPCCTVLREGRSSALKWATLTLLVLRWSGGPCGILHSCSYAGDGCRLKVGDFLRVACAHQPAKSLVRTYGTLGRCAVLGSQMAKVERSETVRKGVRVAFRVWIRPVYRGQN